MRALQVRNVPDTTYAALQARAAERGVTLQEYLRQELDRLASRPDPWAALARQRSLIATSGKEPTRDAILDAIAEGRRA
jgi:plasmid stability protein